MDLKTLLVGDYKDVKVEWNGHVIGVTFDPLVYTPALEAKVMEASRSAGFVDLLLPLVKSWDITEDGEPYAVSGEHIADLPLGLLMAIVTTIGKELQSDPSLGGNSDEPS